MKKQIVTTITLLILFLIFSFINIEKDNSKTYKILKVVEADTFYIDINNNNKIDNDELFKIKNIIAFKPLKNEKTKQYCEKLEISIEEYLKVGYLARNLAKENLTNKEVSFVLPKNNEKFIDIKYDNKNLAEILLKNGLAFTYENSTNPLYFQYQNINQIKSNAKEMSVLDFSLINSKTNIAHKINSEHFNSIKNGELFLKKHLKYLGFKLCSYCYNNKIEQDTNIKKQSKNKYSKSINKNFDKIQLFLINPIEFKRPNKNCDTDICKAIVKEINSAKSSIDIAIFGFGEQDAIFNALLNAKKRGVKIQSVADFSENTDKTYSNTTKFIKTFNATTDTVSSFMHNKFIIFDDKKLFTGSTNISSTGTGGYNSNIAVLIESKELVSFYKKEFSQMHKGLFSNKKEKIETKTINIDDSKVTPYFMPKNKVLEENIIPLIKNAKNHIYVSAYYLTNRKLINELIDAKNKNIEVVIIVDAVFANNLKDRIAILRGANVPLKVENWGGKNHEKTIEIDGQYLILGSCNFTKSGFEKNDENILIIENSEIASFYSDYFLYLFNSINNKYLKYIPRAESFESINSCYDNIDNNFDDKIDFEDEGCKQIKNNIFAK